MSRHEENRIDRLFQRKGTGVLSIYMTAGYPGPDDTRTVLAALQDSGADMVEIGMPFSDPLADGPVIQHSSQVALSGGMSLKKLFSQLEGVRGEIHLPLVLMGYLNPILSYGMADFLDACVAHGIDGLIIPDLPPGEYASEYRDLFTSRGIHLILLVSPQTPEERIREIASLSGGFLYLVADASTTGARNEVSERQLDYFRRIADMDLYLPGLVGFGISSRTTFQAACSYTAGAIIGSAFISTLEEGEGEIGERVKSFIASIR